MKENITQDDALYFKDFEEDINKAISDHGTEEFSEAKSWWAKLGLKVDIAEKEMMNEIVETLSKHLTKGLFQLTVEEIINEKECKDAIQKKKDQTIVMRLSRKLSPFKIYVEFVVKSGLMEVKKIRYDFRAEPKVEIKDIKVNIQENKIKNILLGPFIASITLSLLKGDRTVKIGSIKKSLILQEPIAPQ